ncbi:MULTISPECIES: hypothetical protein [unclassified Spirillospora]|uniref:hypothetical protein n=1 Tax=unclassified Spirillospora TaxID=2642701 RepID=UPI00371DA6DB
MNSPQWPGQPPGGPGFPPPPAPHGPPPMPGGPGFPPPRRGGGGPLVPLLIFGLVGVLALLGLGAFVVLESNDDDPDGTTTFPTYTPATPSYSPEPRPTESRTSETPSTPASVLSTTIRTAKGNTFTRAGTRTSSCTSRANTKLRAALHSHPCVGVMHSAVYANPTKKIITAVSIAKFSSPSAASSVSRVTSDKGWPKLLTPSDASGLRQPRPDPAYWTRSWTQGSNVIYAQSYWSTGAATGGRTSSVFATAGELGVEITNTLVWTD